MNIIILFFLILGFFIIAEILYKFGVSADITRKIIHISSGSIIAFFPYFINLKTVLLIGFFSSIVLFWIKKNEKLKSIFDVERKSVGAIIYIPSLMILSYLTWDIPIIFTISTLIIALSDGFAGIVGKYFGKHEYNINGKKTIEGSLVFFILTLIIIYFFLFKNLGNSWENLLTMFTISIILTLVEGVNSRGWDNFVVPILSSLMLYFMLWI